MAVTIRRARPAEAAALSALALRSKAVWGYDAVFLAACGPVLQVAEDRIRAGDVHVAELGGDVAGFYALGSEGDAAEVDLFFVAPEWLRQGVGRALWAHLVGEAGRRGCQSLRIEADPGAAPFYRRMGATVTGTAPSEVDPARHLPLLHLVLGERPPSS